MPCDPGPRPQKKGDCQLLPAETTKRLQINPCREFRRLHCKAKFHCLFFDTLPPRLSTDHSYSRLAMQLFRKDRQARHCWVLFQLAHRYSRATGPPKYQSKTLGSFLLMPEESSENSGCHDWSWKQLETHTVTPLGGHSLQKGDPTLYVIILIILGTCDFDDYGPHDDDYKPNKLMSWQLRLLSLCSVARPLLPARAARLMMLRALLPGPVRPLRLLGRRWLPLRSLRLSWLLTLTLPLLPRSWLWLSETSRPEFVGDAVPVVPLGFVLRVIHDLGLGAGRSRPQPHVLRRHVPAPRLRQLSHCRGLII